MKKSFIALSILISQSFLSHAQEICAYTSKISAKDKIGRSGVSLLSSNTLDTVALFILQDRANFYRFNQKDAEDEKDCKFSSIKERSKIKSPNRILNISPELIQKMIDQELTVRVAVLENGLEISEISKSDVPIVTSAATPATAQSDTKTKVQASSPRAPEVVQKPEPPSELRPDQVPQVNPAPGSARPPLDAAETLAQVAAPAQPKEVAQPKSPPSTTHIPTQERAPAAKQSDTRSEGPSVPKFFPSAPRYSNEQAILFYNVFSRHYLLAMSLDAAASSNCAKEIKNYPAGGFAFNSRMNIIDFFNKQNQSNFGSQLINEIILNTQMERMQFDELFKNTDNCTLTVTKGEFAYELSNNNFGFKN